MENKLIVDTADIAEEVDFDEDLAPEEDMAATTGPSAEEDKIEFHVQMRSHTMRDMEQLVIEAAARQVMGRFSTGTLAKQIEQRCIELLNEKATAALDGVTTEIIDQPLTPKFGDKQPVTMREFIGLYGREYLEVCVGRDGKPYDGWGGSGMPRMQWLAEQALDRKFTREIEKATSTAILEIQKTIQKQHQVLIDAEKERFRAALERELKPSS